MADERAFRLGHSPLAPVPSSTYRLQLSADFTLADAAEQLPYFASLGASHLYLSPLLAAAPGALVLTAPASTLDTPKLVSLMAGRESIRTSEYREPAEGLRLVLEPPAGPERESPGGGTRPTGGGHGGHVLQCLPLCHGGGGCGTHG